MRPPTAQAFQPYEVAEDYDIEYNQNYEYDPNVEVLPLYFHISHLVFSIVQCRSITTFHTSCQQCLSTRRPQLCLTLGKKWTIRPSPIYAFSSLSSIFSRSESIPEFIPNSARSAPPTPKEDDEPLATPLEDSLDEIEEEEETKEEAKEEQEKA